MQSLACAKLNPLSLLAVSQHSAINNQKSAISMLAKVYTCAVIGLDAQIVEVEVDTGRGLPAVFLVGLPDAAVKESSERVRSAIKNSGLRMHDGRVTVNLAPADLRKAGPSYDLPIAIGILAATDQIPDADLDQGLFVGELG